MKKLFMGVMLSVAGIAAHAAGMATLTCGNAAPGVQHNGMPPVLNIVYTPDGDAGTPGLFFVGLLSPDQKQGAVLTPAGWTNYQGGLYPPQARYDGGLPPSISLTVGFPDGAGVLSTASLEGFAVYVGHGAYTAQAQQTVANRRSMLNSVRAQRVAAGTWRADYDSDDRIIWSLIQKDMTDKQKFVGLLTVPSIDCSVIQSSN